MKIKYLVTQGFTRFIIGLFFLAFILSMGADAQDRDAKRNYQMGIPYAVSDIESINTTNGNLIFNFEFGDLPKGRITANVGFALRYNSKLYESQYEETLDSSGQQTAQLFIADSEEGGWRFDEPYRLRIISRDEGSDQPTQISLECGKPNYKAVYKWKVMLYFPDGSQHEFRPTGYSDKSADGLFGQFQTGDGYFNVHPNGTIQDLVYGYVLGNAECPTRYQAQIVNYQNPASFMTYYSSDGTYMRLIYHPNGAWELSFPDGSKVIQNVSSGNHAPQRIYDRNGNYFEQGAVTLPDGAQAGGWKDQFGRYIARKSNQALNEDYIYSQGYNGEILKWTVKWKDIYVVRPYRTSGAGGGRIRGGSSNQLFCGVFESVDKIKLPEQLGGLEYVFSYNASDTDVGCNVQNPVYSPGWGEVKDVSLPSGAKTEYKYALLINGGTSSFALDPNDPETSDPNFAGVTMDTNMLLPRLGKVREKKLIYTRDYDGVETPVTEIWNYSIGSSTNTITAPDGSVTKQFYHSVSNNNALSGRVYKETKSDGTIIERIWAHNQPNGFQYGSQRRLNTFVQTEFITIPDASGNPALTAIKDFKYDKNGNLIRVVEYDWVSSNSITRSPIAPPVVTSIPGNAVPLRITENVYYNQTEDATNTTINNSNSYWNATAPAVRNALASTTVKKADTNEVVSHSELYYDNPAVTANLVQTKTWDSWKNGIYQPYSNPLNASNSISTSTGYDQYGNPTLLTDARGNQTHITYGDIISPNGMVSGLYPTQTITAYGTSIAQTVQTTYDFYTGLSKTLTKLGNISTQNVTDETEYDALGRPIKMKSAVGTPFESWTTTEYNNALRRVVVRSDVATKGDGKKIAVQHYDQLGRIRLSRTIENALTEDPYNETHGIKIQTRYKYVNGSGKYTLTSNPYRAATSTQAANEPTMGWKVEFEDKDEDLSKSETFSGAVLPAPWGSNTNSMGVVKEEEDAIATLTTDEREKKRRFIKDVLGRLIRVDEPDENNNLGSVSSPVQPTNYSYDTLGNLTQIVQGEQTREFSYSSLSRLISATNPESGTFQYSYDNNGNLTKKKDARNISTLFTYDALNRVTFRNYSDATPDIAYFYDEANVLFSKGNLTGVSSSIAETRYTAFDAQNRVSSSQQIIDGQAYSFDYTYNLNDDLLTQTYPSGKTVKFDYDNEGDLAQVGNQQTQKIYANSFSYAAHGKVERMRLGNGRWETTKFNDALQITEIGLGYSMSDTGLWRVNYEYGNWENNVLNQQKNNGNLARQTITVPTIGQALGFTAVQTYTYDSLDRLKSAEEQVGGAQKWKQTFLYDRYTNRRFDTANTTIQSVLPNLPKVTNPEILSTNNRYKQDQDNDGQADYLYDEMGNLTKDAENRTFTYDAENRQTAATGNNVSMTYAYDGNGKRVKTYNAATAQTTVFIYDANGDLAAEYMVNVPAPQNPTISYLTEDALGSVRVTTNSFGEVKARRDFLPFGEELYAGIGSRSPNQRYSANGDDTRKKFATYQRDSETGLDFAQSRYYSPMQGRFTSPDEFKGGPDELFNFEADASDNPTFYADLENPQSLNKYQYTYNNPYRYVDPDGHTPWTKIIQRIVRSPAGRVVERWATRQWDKLTGKKVPQPTPTTSTPARLPATKQQVSQIIETIRKSNLGRDAARGGKWMGEKSKAEARTAVRLEQKLGIRLTRARGVGDWVDRAGRVYDAVGSGLTAKNFNARFLAQIRFHLRKKGVDRVVLDIRGLNTSQVRTVRRYVERLSQDQQRRIITLQR